MPRCLRDTCTRDWVALIFPPVRGDAQSPIFARRALVSSGLAAEGLRSQGGKRLLGSAKDALSYLLNPPRPRLSVQVT